MATSSKKTASNRSTRRSKKARMTGVAPDVGAPVLPNTIENLFAALMQPVFSSLKQPLPDNPGKRVLHHYMMPWPGYTDITQSREILEQFEKLLGPDVEWHYFNGSDSSAAQMSQACDPTKAVCENVTNTMDACVLRAADEAGDLQRNPDGKWIVNPSTGLTSPMEAVERYFGFSRDDFMNPDKIDDLGGFAKCHSVVRVFGGYDEEVCIVDIVDAGCGVAAKDDTWANTLLSLNRGFKALLLIAIGKWGWGAGGCYQNANMSLLASVVPGTDELMFTLVEKEWMSSEDRVPTFRYLTVKGRLPKIKVPTWWSDLMMPGEGHRPSTIIRHFTYQGALTRGSGDRSIGAVLDRLLPNPVLPVWSEYVHMMPGTHRGAPSHAGNRRTGRLVRGTFNKLRDSWRRKTLGLKVKKGGTDLIEVRHYDYFDIDLGDHDFGGRTGVKAAGAVRAEVWVVQPKENQTESDALRNLVNPDCCVLFHLDGQTHAEERSTLVRSPAVGRGADLAHVGRRCVIGVDCSKLSREAKFDLFGSSREHMKNGDLHKRLKQLLIQRLRHNEDLRRVDGEIAMERSKKLKRPDDKEFASALQQYLDKADFKFQTIQQTLKRRVKVIENQERSTKGRPKPPPPIPPEVPPTTLRWKIQRNTVKMYPGQSYSWVLETSAPTTWWDPTNMGQSSLKILAGGSVKFNGADSFKGGRLRCHFECPATAKVGDTGFIQAQIDYPPEYGLGALTAHLRVEVVEKQKPKPSGKSPKGGDPGGTGKKVVQVEVWKDELQKVDVPLFAPVPLSFSENKDLWDELQWGTRAAEPSFSLVIESGEAFVYYNKEFKDFLDVREKTVKKHPGTEDKFLKEYEMKLALEAIFMLNQATYEAYDMEKEERDRVHKMNRATARNLAMDVGRELDLETQLNAEKGIE